VSWIRPTIASSGVLAIRFQRRVDDLLRVVEILRFDQRGDERIDELRVPGVDLQRLAEDLDCFVQHAALEQHPPDAVVLLQRLGRVVDLRVQVGELDVDVDRVRVELRDLLVDQQRVPGIAVLEVVVGEDLVLALRLHCEALLRVQVGELRVDVELRRIELVDLLVDRDRFVEEAVLPVVVGDLAEDLHRFVVAVDADPEISDAIEGVDVVGIVFEEAFVLLDRGLDLPLGNELFRARDDSIALNRHVPRYRRKAASAPPPLRTICDESGSDRTFSVRPDVLQSRIPGCA
jgi:hypothetical protein